MAMLTNATVIGPKLISFSTYHSFCPKFNFSICQSKSKVKRMSKHKLKFKSIGLHLVYKIYFLWKINYILSKFIKLKDADLKKISPF